MPDKTEWMKLHAQMADGGPIYTETNPLETIVEPWNALSSLSFLVPALYWAWQCRSNLRGNIFLLFCCFLLTIGGLGSTFFHAFRKFPWLLLMDVFPIILLTLLVSIYLWLKVLPSRWWLFLVLLPSFFLRYWAMQELPAHEGINVGYFISGTLIFLPLLFILFQTGFSNWYYIFLAVVCLSLALLFRKIDADNPPLMEVGTHWLWHLLCAGGAYYLGNYIYQLGNLEPKNGQ